MLHQGSCSLTFVIQLGRSIFDLFVIFHFFLRFPLGTLLRFSFLSFYLNFLRSSVSFLLHFHSLIFIAFKLNLRNIFGFPFRYKCTCFQDNCTYDVIRIQLNEGAALTRPPTFRFFFCYCLVTFIF